MSTQIRVIDDVEVFYRDSWPLMEEFQQHHQQIVGLPLRPEAKTHYLRRLQRKNVDPVQRLIAYNDGEPFAMSVARVSQSGWSGQERMGRLGDFFVRQDRRGSTVVLQMHRMLEEWLLEQGITVAQRDTLVANDRALRLWRHLGYAPVEHRLELEFPRPDLEPDPAITVRRIDEPDAEWDVIGPFLARRDSARSALTGFALPLDRAEWRRDALLKGAEKRQTVYLAERDGALVGLAAVRMSINPWIFQQRKGFFTDLEVAPGEDATAVTSALLARAYTRLQRKGAARVQRDVLVAESDEVALWNRLGFRPMIETLRKQLA